jgi:hypothetical protein
MTAHFREEGTRYQSWEQPKLESVCEIGTASVSVGVSVSVSEYEVTCSFTKLQCHYPEGWNQKNENTSKRKWVCEWAETKGLHHKLWFKFNSDSYQHKKGPTYTILENKHHDVVTGISIERFTDPTVKKIKFANGRKST